MKNSFKKLLAVVMCLVMLFAFSGVGASAANYANPVFSVTVLDETDSMVRVSLNLVSGKFNCLDFTFKAVSGYKLVGIVSGSALKAYNEECNNSDITPSMGATNASNGSVSVACSSLYDNAGSFYVASYEKSSTATSKNGDFSVSITNCSILEDGETILLFPTTQYETVLSLSETSLELNYKDSASISCVTNAASDCTIKWSSSDSDVVTVDENGEIYASGKGEAEVICEVIAPSGEVLATASCDVTVSYSILQWIIIVVLFGFLWYI